MGCDIHAHVIVKRPVYIKSEDESGRRKYVRDGYKWELVNLWEKTADDEAENGYRLAPAECWSGRNYDLFGILAGVRSLVYPAIDSPRGFPIGCPQELIDYVENEWSGSAHSTSWLSLGELNKAVRNKKKYPKWETWEDEDGIVHKSDEYPGPHATLKDFRDSVRHFSDLAYWTDDEEDVRVVFFFDS